ncbi:MAG: 4Fe-4S dicluster domain-containing protein [Bacteroidetes bacterium]|nr:MAG: 4Fe-4S dicluster domain-containing protein [Bacteroidota bacterium]
MSNDPSQIKKFLTEKILRNRDRDKDPDLLRQLSHISGERISVPMIYVGTTSCAIAAGAKKTYKAIEKYIDENQLSVKLIEGGCTGYCKAEPLVDVQLPGKARVSFQNVTHELIPDFLDEILNNSLPENLVLGQYHSEIHQLWDAVPFIHELPFNTGQTKILTANCGITDPVSVAQYIARGGYQAFADTISRHTPAEVCDIVEKSELAGRGGGAFLAGKKWKITLNAASDQKYFVCNAVESDPGSYMNRVIMESDPHKLIEALLIAAYAIGASKAFIFTRNEFSLSIKRLNAALQQAEDYGITGHNIFDSGVNIDIVVKEGARAFVCGEETALNNSIEGKRAMPSFKPPFPAIRGLWNKPTIINNLETLINVPLILKNGPEWFKSIGNDTSKGTKLFSLSGKVSNYGTIEVEMGTTFRYIVENIGGGVKDNSEFKAIILGINSGSYITEKTLDIKVDFDELKQAGSQLGSGACVVVGKESCMLDLARFFTTFFKNESCGKCIPCREGTALMLEIIEAATRKPAKGNTFQTLERFKGIMQLKGLAAVMKDTSLCSLGKSAPNAILNTLANFKTEFDAHIFERKCPAGVCRELRTYHIDVDMCTGCTACYKKCPVDAIIGAARQPHFVVQDKCIACNACFEACKFNAVIID